MYWVDTFLLISCLFAKKKSAACKLLLAELLLVSEFKIPQTCLETDKFFVLLANKCRYSSQILIEEIVAVILKNGAYLLKNMPQT